MTVPVTDGITTMQVRRAGTVLTSPVIYEQLDKISAIEVASMGGANAIEAESILKKYRRNI